jgi:Na+-transporting methylmalonyl-CoA/oxaloacetate decarboxylase gamma subunit
VGIEVVLVVLAVVVLMIGGTVFSAWRAERAAEDDAAEDETLP